MPAPSGPRSLLPPLSCRGLFEDRAGFVPLLQGVRDTDFSPPLHPLALWLVHFLAGPNLIAHRTLSLACVLAALLALISGWKLDEKTNAHSWVWAALILSTLPDTYYAATTARGYGLASLFLSVAFFGFILLIHKRDLAPNSEMKAGLLLPGVIGLTAGLAILTHYLAGLAAGVLVFNSLWLLGRRRNWSCIAAQLAAGFVPVAIAGYFVLHGAGSGPGHLRAFPGLLELTLVLLVKMLVFVPGEGPPNADLVLFRLILLVTPGLVLLIGAALIHRLRREGGQRWVLGLALQAVFVHIAGLMFLSYVTDKTLEAPRYLSIVWPFTAFVLAKGALWFSSGQRALRLGWAVPVFLIGVQISQLFLALRDSPGQRWAEIARAADTSARKPLLIIDGTWGRGSGAVAFSGVPKTYHWIVKPDDLAAAPTEDLLSSYNELHIALSWNDMAREEIEDWLRRLKATSSFVEQESKIADHRHLIRSADE